VSVLEVAGLTKRMFRRFDLTVDFGLENVVFWMEKLA
jgi:hypothetical protein